MTPRWDPKKWPTIDPTAAKTPVTMVLTKKRNTPFIAAPCLPIPLRLPNAALVVLRERQKLFRCCHSVTIAQQILQLLPVAVTVEPDADPAAGSHVGRREETIRRGIDHQTLIHGFRLAPNRVTTASMVGIRVRVHCEDLVLHSKSRLSPRLDFVGFRKSEANLAQARKRAWRHPSNPGRVDCGAQEKKTRVRRPHRAVILLQRHHHHIDRRNSMLAAKRRLLVNRVIPVVIATVALHGCTLNTDLSHPATIAIVSGDAQTAAVNTALPDSLTVIGVGAFFEPIPDATVTWTIVAPGGGSLSSVTSQTDQYGLAWTRYTAGATAGTVKIQAQGSTLPPGFFYVTVTP